MTLDKTGNYFWSLGGMLNCQQYISATKWYESMSLVCVLNVQRGLPEAPPVFKHLWRSVSFGGRVKQIFFVNDLFLISEGCLSFWRVVTYTPVHLVADVSKELDNDIRLVFISRPTFFKKTGTVNMMMITGWPQWHNVFSCIRCYRLIHAVLY